MPMALCGSAPCLSDITDWDLMLENRYTLAVNGAIEMGKFHGLVLADYRAHYALKSLEPHHHLYIYKPMYDRILHSNRFQSPKVEELLENHKNTVIMEIPQCLRYDGHGTPNVFMRFAYNVLKVKYVELYGIDMDGKYKAQQRGLMEDMDNMEIFNCCPSSKLPNWLPKGEMPWCGGQTSR